MPETWSARYRRKLYVPEERVVWVHTLDCPGGERFGVSHSDLARPFIWYDSEEMALDAYVDKIREEIAFERLDAYNTERETLADTITDGDLAFVRGYDGDL